MSEPLPLARAVDDCWNRIGVGGDRTCPELPSQIHCRNCPVFSSAAQSFFDRPAPAGYIAEWTRLLAPPEAPVASDDVSLLLFRLGAEWLALGSRVVAEVTSPRPVHKIPHRGDEVLAGLVNLRGQLQLCVWLHGLLGVEAGPIEAPGEPGAVQAAQPRLVVIGRDAETWAFPADEVPGVHRLPRHALRNVPATLANPTTSFSQAVFTWEGRSIGYLDDQRIFSALRSLGQ